MEVKLFISTFNRKVNWKRCIPLEVGTACRETALYEVKDDTGDNISELNPWFGELTGIYWVWKNYKFAPGDIVGFSHWNKILNISQKKVVKLISNNSGNYWIVPDIPFSVSHDYPEDIEVLENVLKHKYPECFSAFASLYNHDGSSKEDNNKCAAQLWYTTVDEFNKYCEFLFNVLFDVFKIQGKVERPPYHKRYLAFLAERLVAVYLVASSACVFRTDVLYKNNGKLMRIIKKINPIKNTGFYLKLKKRYGADSSYNKLFS